MRSIGLNWLTFSFLFQPNIDQDMPLKKTTRGRGRASFFLHLPYRLIVIDQQKFLKNPLHDRISFLKMQRPLPDIAQNDLDVLAIVSIDNAYTIGEDHIIF